MVQILAALGLVFTAAIWGFSFVVVKDSLNDISAVYMIAIRFAIAALSVGIVFFKRLKKINAQYLKKAGLIGVFLFLAYFAQTVGCKYTTPGRNAFLTTFYVVLIPFCSWIAYKKRPAWTVFAAVLLQVAGIGFLSLGGKSEAGAGFNFGDFLTLVCAVLAWCVAPFYDAEKNMVTAVFQPLSAIDFGSRGFIMSALYLGIACTAVAFVLQNIGLKYLSPSLSTILLSFESVFGMLFSVLIPVNGVREKLSVYGVAGCALIFAAVIIAQRQKN